MTAQIMVRLTLTSAIFAFGIAGAVHAQQLKPVVSAAEAAPFTPRASQEIAAPPLGNVATATSVADKPATEESAKEKKQNKKKKDAKAAKEAKRPQFIRILRDADGGSVSLDTSIVTYKNKDGVKVALIGALHIGEKDYYQDLNKEFRRYDTILYELVAKKGTRVPKGGGAGNSRSPLSSMQSGMKNMLGLAFQLEEVDYTKKNFVHADLSPEEFAKSMDEKGESFLKMYFRMLGHGMAQQSKGQTTEFDMLMSFFNSDKTARQYNLRQAMAGQFEDVESSMAAIEGEEGSTIIRARNDAALKVLKDQIAKGDKKIGIFYGAGHLPHMHDVLINDFKMKVVRTRWLESWRLAPPAEEKKGEDS